MTGRAGASSRRDASSRRGADRDMLPFKLLMGVTAGGIGGIVTVLGELRDELGFSGTGIGIMVASGFVAAFVSQVTLARLADAGHYRIMATVGIALSAAAMLVMVFAGDLAVWILSRAALGFAGGLILPGVRRAASVRDPARAGENLGRMVVAETTGFIFGPTLTALLVWVGGIRLPFAVFAAAMLAFLPVAVRLPPDRGRLDASGRATSFDLLLHRRLQGALIMVAGYFMMIGAWEAVLPVMFADRGAGAIMTGLTFTMVALPIMMVGTRAGRLADRVGPVRVTMAGLVTVSVATMTFGVIPGVIPIAGAMMLVGFADGYGFTAAHAVVARAVPEHRQAAALGLMGAAEVAGAAAAALPAAWMYDSFGSGPTWAAVGLAVLVLVVAGWLRIRGTVPASGPDAPAPRPH
ncbi:MAG: MFS transporter [Acidimicrobiaceae bacterium]|nr:MFS transporter [Acidimicrobiaceae bacterium]MYH76837.1 MFS transporter [Acidimicrobiaceae bacterium]MYK77374.1 MFS transporter [Acidimicrobiaceae bacterium]